MRLIQGYEVMPMQAIHAAQCGGSKQVLQDCLAGVEMKTCACHVFFLWVRWMSLAGVCAG
jgi:hypothetical protein